MALLEALGVVGVLVASSLEVQREERAERLARLGRARARAVDDGQRCPFCREAFDAPTPDPEQDDPDEGARIRCPDCGTRHHLLCWREHGTCSVYGCGRNPDFAPEEPPPAPDAAPAGDPRG